MMSFKKKTVSIAILSAALQMTTAYGEVPQNSEPAVCAVVKTALFAVEGAVVKKGLQDIEADKQHQLEVDEWTAIATDISANAKKVADSFLEVHQKAIDDVVVNSGTPSDQPTIREALQSSMAKMYADFSDSILYCLPHQYLNRGDKTCEASDGKITPAITAANFIPTADAPHGTLAFFKNIISYACPMNKTAPCDISIPPSMLMETAHKLVLNSETKQSTEVRIKQIASPEMLRVLQINKELASKCSPLTSDTVANLTSGNVSTPLPVQPSTNPPVITLTVNTPAAGAGVPK